MLRSAMVELTRAVRFCINPDDRPWGAGDNTFAAYPSFRGLGRYYELDVSCRGEVNPDTGYFLNIKQIDQAVRSGVVPMIEQACRERPSIFAGALLPGIVAELDKRLGHEANGKARVAKVRWRLTPYHSVEMHAADTQTVLLRQQFEFAASHRLHSAGLSDTENRAMFGKCNNPSGHGHNYRVEPCVELRLAEPGDNPALSLADIERLVNQTLIERYDHKHLNVDTPEFACEVIAPAPGGTKGVNPSVENIARECFQRLSTAIAAAAPNGDAKLRNVTVWETDKTSCTFPA